MSLTLTKTQLIFVTYFVFSPVFILAFFHIDAFRIASDPFPCNKILEPDAIGDLADHNQPG